MTSAAAPVLEAQEVTRTFPGAPPLRVLRGVSLAVHRGERVAIFGRSWRPVSEPSEMTLAMPKSRILMKSWLPPRLMRKQLSGFMSR